MAKPTFFFYDLETSGLNSGDDRIMQFAGQRTSLNLEPVGEPYNILVKLSDDTLPSPGAILTTKITPQKTLEEGILEPELTRILVEEVFTPDTIAVGYNSVRFDDKFVQHLFWRNFYDPYEWQWKDGRSRWDMLDVVRMTRALRPEGINWPTTEEGKPTNRLELITKENGISHESAHDALSDVNALIDVARLIKDRQPKLFSYLLKMRDKREVKSLINLENPSAFVYSSGRFGSKYNFTTVAFPLFLNKKGNVIVFDLRVDLNVRLKEIESDEELKKKPLKDALFPAFKELAFNRCPAVAPLGVLAQDSGWKKIELSEETVKKNLETLKSHPEVLKKIKSELDADEFDRTPVDAESSLYSSFPPEEDKARMSAVRSGTADSLADFHPNFLDDRLSDLLVHYKAKNFPTSLTEDESKKWQEYRKNRIERQSKTFIPEMQKFQQEGADEFLLEELYLWFQSLQESDY